MVAEKGRLVDGKVNIKRVFELDMTISKTEDILAAGRNSVCC